MQRPKVSVAMATYNGARFVREQLESFANQTVLPDEIVVGDDTSSDDTIAVIEEFARNAPFAVRVQRNPENYGYTRNFCETIQRCTGDIIFLSDQDDFWLPDKVDRCVQALQQPGALLVTHDARLADGSLNPTDMTMYSQLRAVGDADPASLNYGCCIAFNGYLAEFVSPPPYEYHDMWLAVIAARMGGRVFIDEPLILFRRHGGNTSTSHLTSLKKTHPALAFLNRLQVARREGAAKSVSDSLSWASNLLEVFQRNREGVVARIGESRYAEIVADLRGEWERLSHRNRIHTGSTLFRPYRVARFAMAGGYRRNSSFFSVIRDLIG